MQYEEGIGGGGVCKTWQSRARAMLKYRSDKLTPALFSLPYPVPSTPLPSPSSFRLPIDEHLLIPSFLQVMSSLLNGKSCKNTAKNSTHPLGPSFSNISNHHFHRFFINEKGQLYWFSSIT